MKGANYAHNSISESKHLPQRQIDTATALHGVVRTTVEDPSKTTGFLDIKEAFNNVNNEDITKGLEIFGVSSPITNLIAKSKSYSYVRCIRLVDRC